MDGQGTDHRGGCDEKCGWGFLGNIVDHKSNKVDSKVENLVVYVLKQSFATDAMTINFRMNPTLFVVQKFVDLTILLKLYLK